VCVVGQEAGARCVARQKLTLERGVGKTLSSFIS
jgi:hypothetical protein